MGETLSAVDFLQSKPSGAAPGVCVAFGDQPFLKRLVLNRIRDLALGAEADDYSLTTFDSEALPRDVFDELSTRALFGGGPRMVVIEDADDFVSKHRSMLEDYVARPGGGVLMLVVTTWPSNTKLYKAVAGCGWQIDCKAPSPAVLTKWLTTWARQTHHVRLDRAAAETLVDIIGSEAGLLDQELAKLAAAAAGQEISPELVQKLVGGWQAQTAWVMLDAAVEGQTAVALTQLDRLLLSGGEPIGILAQIGSSLRRFAAAARFIEQAEAQGQRANPRGALEAAGVKPFVLGKSEAQLKKLGRQRAARLYRWLLEADLALKRSSSRGRARILLEQLICRLSGAADPRATSAPRRASR